MSTAPNYVVYYTRTIQQHATGLKNTPGGTGNGKTSAIHEVVRADTTGRQFLYVANRVQLLGEMAAKLTEANVPFVHLQRDTDLVIQLLQSPERRADLDDLLHTPALAASLAAIDRASTGILGDVPIRRAVARIDQLLPLAHADAVGDIVEEDARIVMHTLQRLLREVARAGTGSERSRVHRNLTAHPAIRHLFPYITFRETRAPILLGTQK